MSATDKVFHPKARFGFSASMHGQILVRERSCAQKQYAVGPFSMTALEVRTMASSPENGPSADVQTTESTGISKWRRGLRYVFAITAPALVMLYVAGILDGTFAKERRLNTS